MATTTANVTTTATYTVEYLEESRTALLNAFYSVPIPLEIVSTAFRLWVKIRAKGGRLAFDDYLIVWATVRVLTSTGMSELVDPPLPPVFRESSV